MQRELRPRPLSRFATTVTRRQYTVARRPSVAVCRRWSHRCTRHLTSHGLHTERSSVMKYTTLFFCAVIISCTATAMTAQGSPQQPSQQAPGARTPGALTPDQLLPLAPSVPPVPPPSSILSAPLGTPTSAPTNTPPPPVVYVPTLSSSSTACAGGGSPASTSSPSSTGSGVNVSQLPRAGVPADAFTRPGVSAAQLGTMTPSVSSSGMSGTACTQQSGGSVWYPDPLPPPRPLLPPLPDSSTP